MKYKAKRQMVKARKAIASGDWKKGDKLIDSAQKIDASANLSYRDLRALAKLRRNFYKAITWLNGLISSNTETTQSDK